MNELILLVDDEPSIIQLARLYLEREGFRIQSVNDGEAALENIACEQPALVVLDVMLPGRNGYDVCQTIRGEPGGRDIKIIMLTAKGRDVEMNKGLSIGADLYITKPFSTQELVAKINGLLGVGTA